MINIDKEFKEKVSYDNIETETGVVTSVASINTRQVQKEETITIVPTIHIDKPFKMDMQPFINRPFFLESVAWDNTKPKFSLLNLLSYRMPRDIITSNSTLLNGMKVGTLYRMAGKLNVSVAGTITHSGCILVGLIPPLPTAIDFSIPQPYLINTILSGPHGFLFANEATSIMLDIPWYCNTDLDSLTVDDVFPTALTLNKYPANCATLVMMVINPLQPSTGSSTNLTIVVEANLTNLEVYVPSPQYLSYQPQSYFTNLGSGLLDSAAKYAKRLTGDAIDGLRAGIREYTGLHNPNVPPILGSQLVVQRNRLNNTDVPTYLEHLDSNANFVRIVQEPIFNTLEDEMAIGHIIKKRQYIGTFRVNQNDPVGKLLFARPISPYQGGVTAYTGDTGLGSHIVNNIELLHYYTRAWKGTIKLHIQAVMNNKQQVKLRLLQLYNPTKAVLLGQPLYATALQAPSHLLEFSAGGQEHEISLPYLSRTRLMTCARDSSLEALLHGMYYIYVAQPLANSADSPSDIFFNMYMSLEEDFTFHGYSTEVGGATGPFKFPQQALLAVKRDTESVSEEPKKEEGSNAGSEKLTTEVKTSAEFPFKTNFEVNYKPESFVMNEPQKQKSDNDGKMIKETDTRILPLVDVRPIIRRLYQTRNIPLTLSNTEAKAITISLSRYIGESVEQINNPCVAISKMYYGKEAGVKMRVRVRIVSGLIGSTNVKFFYVPPQFYPKVDGSTENLLGGTFPNLNLGYVSDEGQFPLTNITVHALDSFNYIYEFTVPNTSILKFIGGPNKMVYEASNDTYTLAVEDLGHIVCTLEASGPYQVKVHIEGALTDESRLGFHTIAPVIERVELLTTDPPSLLTTGIGSTTDAQSYPPRELKPSLYTNRL